MYNRWKYTCIGEMFAIFKTTLISVDGVFGLWSDCTIDGNTRVLMKCLLYFRRL